MAVTGAFATTTQVNQAIDGLMAEGFKADEIAAVTASGEPIDSLTPTATDRANKVWKGAGVGALIGGAAGLVVTTLLMPEVGVVLVAGELVTGGAITGGLIGALVKAGHSNDQAEALAEHVKSGKYLVIVHATAGAMRAETVLRNAGAHEVHTTAEA
jgi:hypothetical protein